MDTAVFGCRARLWMEVRAVVKEGLPRRRLAERAEGSQGGSCGGFGGETQRLALYFDTLCGPNKNVSLSAGWRATQAEEAQRHQHQWQLET